MPVRLFQTCQGSAGRRARNFRRLTLLVALMIGGVGGTQAAETLRVGIEGAYPPFSRIDAKGHIAGFDPEIAQALCKQMQVSCKLIKQNWDKAIPDLNEHKIDVLISSMSITPERQQLVTFTRPYYNSPVRFIVRRDAALEVDPPAKLSGKTIAVESNSIYENFVREVYVPAGAKMLVVTGGAENVPKAMVAGKADATPNDVVANADFLKTAAGKRFMETGPSFTDPQHLGAGAAIAVAKGNTELAARFDGALMAIHKSGEYARIRERYFTFDIWAQ